MINKTGPIRGPPGLIVKDDTVTAPDLKSRSFNFYPLFIDIYLNLLWIRKISGKFLERTLRTSYNFLLCEPLPANPEAFNL